MKICPKTMNCCSVLSINMICIRQIHSPTETSIHTRSGRVLMNSLSSVRLTVDTKMYGFFLSASRKRGSLDTIVTDFKFAHSSFTASSLIYFHFPRDKSSFECLILYCNCLAFRPISNLGKACSSSIQ